MTNSGQGIVVYGASSSNIDPRFVDFAREVGREIAMRGYTLISGGGRGGLMAAAIEGATAAGGKTIGVLPKFMIDREWQHPTLTEVIVTETMHRRKMTMARLSLGAIALPGGVGTLDELFEMITWRQLGLYNGPVVIANQLGFYDSLLTHLHHTASQGFMRPRALWSVATTPVMAVDEATSQPDIPDPVDPTKY